MLDNFSSGVLGNLKCDVNISSSWEKALMLATTAARALPNLLSTHWDIALTPDGPIILEVNLKNCFVGHQSGFSKGALDSVLRQFLIDNKQH